MTHHPVTYGPGPTERRAACDCGWRGDAFYYGPRARAYAFTDAVMHCEWADEFDAIVNAPVVEETP